MASITTSGFSSRRNPQAYARSQLNLQRSVRFQSATDRLTFFFRYGYADVPVNALTSFVSIGAVLQKPLPGRDHDFLQGAVAWGSAALHDETLLEVGYSLHVTDSLTLTPLMQVIADPAQNPQDDVFCPGRSSRRVCLLTDTVLDTGGTVTD